MRAPNILYISGSGAFDMGAKSAGMSNIMRDTSTIQPEQARQKSSIATLSDISVSILVEISIFLTTLSPSQCTSRQLIKRLAFQLFLVLKGNKNAVSHKRQFLMPTKSMPSPQMSMTQLLSAQRMSSIKKEKILKQNDSVQNPGIF